VVGFLIVQGAGGRAQAHSSKNSLRVKSGTLNMDRPAGLNSQVSHRCYTKRKSGSEYDRTFQRLYIIN